MQYARRGAVRATWTLYNGSREHGKDRDSVRLAMRGRDT